MTVRYFATHNSQIISFDRVDYRTPKQAFGYVAAEKVWVPIERTVLYSNNPSKHVCDDRCLNATGRTMKCECSCGGKNHGRGR